MPSWINFKVDLISVLAIAIENPLW